jgi:hypothetical protein
MSVLVRLPGLWQLAVSQRNVDERWRLDQASQCFISVHVWKCKVGPHSCHRFPRDAPPGSMTCGNCPSGQTCLNNSECVAADPECKKAVACTKANCGTEDDGCGGIVDCECSTQGSGAGG